MRHVAHRWPLAAAVVALGLCACGSAADPDAQAFAGLVAHGHGVSGTVVFTGAVTGTWHAVADPPAICAPAQVRITISGPRAADIGTLSVSSDGSIYLDVEAYGDFLGTGGVLQPGRGFRVDAAIATLRGKRAHVSGGLSC